MSDKHRDTKPFGFYDKLGYMFGDFGNDFTFILSSTFLLKFYTDIMGVSAGIVGTMMMVARFVDAFTDVTMGQLVDRSKSGAKGKFAPWLLKISGPVALASFLMYAVWFRNMPLGFKIFWMFFTYLLWGSVFYTAVNIPYGSMASAISGEPKDRASLSNWRSIGAALASLVIGAGLPQIVYYTDAAGNMQISGTRMAVAAAACSVGAVICYFLCYFMTTERVKVETVKGRFSLTGLIKSLVQNSALIGIVVSALLMLLAQLSLSNMGSYIYPNYFGNVQAMSLVAVLGTVITLALAPFIVPLATATGKKELSVIGAIISAVALIIAYIIHTGNVWVWVALYAVAYVGMAIFMLISWAMITDVIDDTQVRTGSRSDGTIYSVYSFARKLGQAGASGLTGLFLSIIGYSTETAFDTVVVNRIYDITCLVPAISFALLAVSMVFLYPLNKKRVEENVHILKQRAGDNGK